MEDTGLTTLSVVLAFRNREAILADWLGRLMDAAPEGLNWELILVNSASTDKGEKVLAGLGAQPEFSRVKYLPLEKHLGLGHAMQQGLEKAEGRALALSRLDNRWEPADLFKGLEILQRHGLDRKFLVRGFYKKKAKRAPGLRLAGWLATAILWRDLRGLDVQPKVFVRSLLDNMRQVPTGRGYDMYLLFRAALKGYKTLPLEVEAAGDKAEKTPRGWVKETLLAALKLRVSLEP